MHITHAINSSGYAIPAPVGGRLPAPRPAPIKAAADAAPARTAGGAGRGAKSTGKREAEALGTKWPFTAAAWPGKPANISVQRLLNSAEL